MRERIGALTVGNGLDPDAEMGPLITAEHRDKVAGYVDKGIDEGAQLVEDGRDAHRQRARGRLLPRPVSLRPGHP